MMFRPVYISNHCVPSWNFLLRWTGDHCSPQATSGTANCNDSPQPPVVVVLLAEKLLVERVKCGKLLCKCASIHKPVGHQHNLCDHRKVRHTHGYRSEKRLQVVGKFCTACIAWVHCDEESTRGNKIDLYALEIKPTLLATNSIQDALNLHGDNREDLDRDPVKLVEAPQAPDWARPLKMFPIE